MKLPIVKYIKFEGKKIGVMAAVSRHGIGVSICNKKDIFNRDEGRKQAVERALENNISIYNKFDSRNFMVVTFRNKRNVYIRREIALFIDTASRYFNE